MPRRLEVTCLGNDPRQAGLRLGEQRNCLAHHTAESCIFPIDAAGVHSLQAAAAPMVRRP